MALFRATFGVFVLLYSQLAVMSANVIQILSFLFIYPFTKRVDMWINHLVLSHVISCMLLGIENENIDFMISGDAITAENAFLVMNHLSWVDWIIIYMLAKRNHKLPYIKFMVKEAAKLVPGYGWGMYFCHWLLMKRTWEKDRVNVNKALQQYNENCTKYGTELWMMVYPEGTRLTPAKLAASQEFAKTKGLPILTQCMLPRTKGSVVCIEALRQAAIDVIYNITIDYAGFPTKNGIPTMWEVFCGTGSGRKMFVHVQRIPIKDVPKGDEAVSKWLYDVWEQKDQQLAEFRKTGKCDAWGAFHKLAPYSTLRLLGSYALVAAWWSILGLCYVAYSVYFARK